MPIGAILGALGMQAAGGALKGGLDLLFNRGHNKQQQQQNKELIKEQTKGSKELSEFNKNLALEMWKDTNYNEQRKEMEKAGLNVGLMYGQGGGGGTTTNFTAGNVTGGTAGTRSADVGAGMGMGLEAMRAAAEIENIKANTEKTKADTEKTSGVDTAAQAANIEALKEKTKNTKVEGAILEYQKEITRVESEVAKLTQQEVISKVHAERDKLIAEAEKAENDKEISTETKDEIIKQINQQSTEQALRIATQKAGLIKTEADTNAVNQSIQKMAAEITNMAASRDIKWMEIDQAERERFVKEKLLKLQEAQTDFNTSTPQQIRQWTGIITDIIGAIKGTPTGSNSVGFKY